MQVLWHSNFNHYEIWWTYAVALPVEPKELLKLTQQDRPYKEAKQSPASYTSSTWSVYSVMDVIETNKTDG